MANMFESKYLFLICLIIVSYAKSENRPYKFDPRIIVENRISLDEIADDIIYIPLDNIYPVSLIYNCYFTKKSIYLSTKDIGILKFNSMGKYEKRIGAIGRGPAEYTSYLNFTVDDKQETIYVKDRSNRIQVYSGNGAFLRSIYVKEYGGSIELISIFDSKLFLFNALPYANAKYNWIIQDTLGHLIKTKERPNSLFESNWLGRSETYLFNNNLYYWNTFNDTVYKISPELNEEASFLISSGEFRIPRSHFNPSEKTAQYLIIQSIFETDKFMMIRYYFGEKQLLAIIDKKSKKTFACTWNGYNMGGIINDLDNGAEFLPLYYTVENNREYIIGFLDAYQLKTHVASEAFMQSTPKFPAKKKELEKLAKSLKETDNPVLMLVRLKK